MSENATKGRSRGRSDGGTDEDKFRKLFIGGLSADTSNETLNDFYSQFGTLIDCVVMRVPQTKRSRGFGFVSFSSSEELDRAMAGRPHNIDGRIVDPKRAIPRDQSGKAESNISTRRLYVSGVRDEHNEESFNRYFSEYGSVAEVEVITDKNTNKNRGFAFITFDDYDPVDKCVLIKSHMINGFRCDVKKALSRDEMQKAQQTDRDRMERGMRSGRGSPRGGRGGDGRGGGRGGGYGGGYDPPAAGGYGGAYGGGGYGAPAWGAPPAMGPPAQQWGGCSGYVGSYGQSQPTPLSHGGAGSQAAPADQTQWQQQPQPGAAPAAAGGGTGLDNSQYAWPSAGAQPQQQ